MIDRRNFLTGAQGLVAVAAEREALRGDLERVLTFITRLRAGDDDPILAWDEAICASTLGVLADTVDGAGAYYLRSHDLIVELTAPGADASALVSLFSIKGNLVWFYVQSGDVAAAHREHQARLEIVAQLERLGVDPQVLAAMRQQLRG